MPCEPPRLGRREARDLLANKTVAFVGDSVSRMMFCETAAWLFGVKGWWWQHVRQQTQRIPTRVGMFGVLRSRRHRTWTNCQKEGGPEERPHRGHFSLAG